MERRGVGSRPAVDPGRRVCVFVQPCRTTDLPGCDRPRADFSPPCAPMQGTSQANTRLAPLDTLLSLHPTLCMAPPRDRPCTQTPSCVLHLTAGHASSPGAPAWHLLGTAVGLDMHAASILRPRDRHTYIHTCIHTYIGRLLLPLASTPDAMILAGPAQ